MGGVCALKMAKSSAGFSRDESGVQNGVPCRACMHKNKTETSPSFAPRKVGLSNPMSWQILLPISRCRRRRCRRRILRLNDALR